MPDQKTNLLPHFLISGCAKYASKSALVGAFPVGDEGFEVGELGLVSLSTVGLAAVDLVGVALATVALAGVGFTGVGLAGVGLGATAGAGALLSTSIIERFKLSPNKTRVSYSAFIVFMKHILLISAGTGAPKTPTIVDNANNALKPVSRKRILILSIYRERDCK